MAENSSIQWTNHTVNTHWGCVEKGPECAHCYARTLDSMRGPLFDNGRTHWGRTSSRWIKIDSALKQIGKIARRALKTGVRERIFVNSMSDTFEDHPDLPEVRDRFLTAIQEMPELSFQLLTKRPELVNGMVPSRWLRDWPSHVWIGSTMGVQRSVDERISLLLDIPAKVRFLSCEPLLENIELPFEAEVGIHWVICGGESGDKARPMRIEWAQSLADQCRFANIPFFMKQLGGTRNHRGELSDFPESLRVRQFPD